MASKAHRLIHGSSLRVLEFVANALISLVLMPYIIRALGDRMYGLWLFVGTFIGYYGLMDFGLTSAIQRYVAAAVGKGDKDEENQVINTALFIFLIIGVILLLIAITTAALLPRIMSDLSDVPVVKSLLVILGLSLATSFPMRAVMGVLPSHLRFEWSTSLDLVKTGVRTALTIAALMHHLTVLQLAWITFITEFVGNLSKTIAVFQLFPYIKIRFRYVQRAMAKQLFHYSIVTFVGKLADQLRNNMANVIITANIGLAAITPFSIGARLNTYFFQFISSATQMLTPIFSQYHAAGNMRLLQEKYALTTKICSYFALLVGGVLFVLGKYFIIVWMGPSYAASYHILFILVIPTTMSLMQIPAIELLYGVSKHKYFVGLSIVEGVIVLVLSIFLVRQYGIFGIAYSMAVPMFLKFAVLPLFVHGQLGVRAATLYSVQVWAFLRSSVVFVGALWFVRQVQPGSYLMLAACASVISVVFTAWFIVFEFDRQQRAYLLYTMKQFAMNSWPKKQAGA